VKRESTSKALKRSGIGLLKDMTCPPELGPVASAEWDRILSELLVEPDLIKRVDRGLLQVYCAFYADWFEAEAKIQEIGQVIKSPNGYPQTAPWVSIANMRATLMLAIAKEFGFSPVSRGKLPRLSSGPDLLDLPPLKY
jgi:P27 family predicted phage terminase small subunit